MECAHCCTSCRLDRIEELLAGIISQGNNERARENAHYKQILERLTTMATNLETMQAALDALNAATSQEAALLTADGEKLDKIQTLITDLVNSGGVPQTLIDQANAIVASIADVQASTTAQASRLDQLGTDPRNPVPTPAPQRRQP
jgi:hypothetical protein